MTKRGELAFNYAILTAFAVFALYPLLAAVAASFQSTTLLEGLLPIPREVTVDNYARAWTVGRFSSAFVNSATIALLMVPLATIVSILAGYAFGTMRFRGARALFLFFVLGLIIPPEGTIIPLYWDMRAIGLTDTYLGVVLVQVAKAIPFGVFWMRAFFVSVPQTVLDASSMDGASPMATLRLVLLPAAAPAVGTLLLLNFMATFTDFITPLVLIQDPAYRTVPLAFLTFDSNPRAAGDVTGQLAAAVISAIPIVIAFVVFQRQFVKGLLGSSLK